MRLGSSGSEINKVVIAFTAVFEDGTVSCTNNKNAFDEMANQEVIRIISNDVNNINLEFLDRLGKRKDFPREFQDLESLRQWFDARQITEFEERVRRKLFIPMTDEEVSAAKKRIVQADLGLISAPRLDPWRYLRLATWPVALCILLALEFFRPHLFAPAFKGLTYHGENFKTQKEYSSYEDYKDDPDNFNTNELDRIESVMTFVQIPHSFVNREDFIHTVMFDLRFPGYGVSSYPAQTDDGSTIEAESVEIPQRKKDRIIVARADGTKWNLVDDFIFQTLTNSVSRIKLENQVLRYYDSAGKMVREKPL